MKSTDAEGVEFNSRWHRHRNEGKQILTLKGSKVTLGMRNLSGRNCLLFAIRCAHEQSGFHLKFVALRRHRRRTKAELGEQEIMTEQHNEIII